MRSKIIFLSILTFAIFSCQKSGKPENFDYGTVNKDVYSNSFFHFQMSLPERWNVLSQKDADEQQQKGMEVVAGKSNEMKKAIKVSEINTANLLSAFQYPFEVAIGFNPSLIVVAEKVSQTPSIKSANDYLLQSRKVLEQTSISFDSINNQLFTESISGKMFSKMDVVIDGAESKVYQTYYCVLSEGFAISFILSYVNDEQKNILLNSVKSIKFN
ncbi:conserved exported hypothetical protein [uncultured Paludibacter sp.]|uniref:Lipoprotein n=1 Tax=uncultured Paludibacter sp. TaxID=497635 RepID=A0A653A658_9BACT|nr:conserved exported hypothetical protein [uncultured Paludibacter sp.]